MKKLILFLSAFVFVLSLHGQALQLISPTWKIKRVSISAGSDLDMLHGMDYQYFLDGVRGPLNNDYSGLPLEEQYVSGMTCENPHLRISLHILPPGMKNTELQVSLLGIAGRIDAITYATPDTDWSNPEYQSATFDVTTNEIALEASLLKRLPVGKGLNFYAGGGTNLGATFGNSLSIWGQNLSLNNDQLGFREGTEDEFPEVRYINEHYDYNSGISQRLFAQAGFGFIILKRLELGMDFRYGIGYRKIANSALKSTNLHSVGLRASWVLK